MEKISFYHKSAGAQLSINHINKQLHIEDLYASEKRQGHGSELLQRLKQLYPDYTIRGIAAPTESYQIPAPSYDDQEYAYELGFDMRSLKLRRPDYFSPLTIEEKRFLEEFADQMRRHRMSSYEARMMQLLRFYEKNGFAVDISGHFISYPPHTD